MKQKIIILIKGILAGLSISLGGYIYLKTSVKLPDSLLPSLLFSIGLMIVCTFGFYLYTGKICFVYEDNIVSDTNKISNKILSLLFGLLGNLVGCFIFSKILYVIEQDTLFYEKLSNIVTNKIDKTWYAFLLSSMLCGVLVNLAVLGFKKCENEFGKYLLVFICISSFVILGFDHSIANMFYFFTNIDFTWKHVLYLLLCVIGNTIGGLIYPSIELLIKQLNK